MRDLHTEVWPEYAKDQKKDLWFYERLWGVLLRQLKKRNATTLLDYGCGPGFAVDLATRMEFCASGYEPSAKARADGEKAHGLSLWDDLSKMELRGASGNIRLVFEAILCTEVLEHTENPAAELENMKSLLYPGGLLAISVPNDDNPLQSSGAKQPWVHDSHLHYFNPKSLRRLVERSGFEVVWQGSSFPVEVLLAIPFMPRKWAWKLSRLWPAPPFLWRFNIGRHALLVARKRS